MADGGVKQTWEYRINFDWMSFISWTWRWVIRTDPVTNTSVPITTYYYSDGEEDEYELAFNETQNVDWSTDQLDSPWTANDQWYTSWFDNNESDWFRVPDICKDKVEEEERI